MDENKIETQLRSIDESLGCFFALFGFFLSAFMIIAIMILSRNAKIKVQLVPPETSQKASP